MKSSLVAVARRLKAAGAAIARSLGQESSTTTDLPAPTPTYTYRDSRNRRNPFYWINNPSYDRNNVRKGLPGSKLARKAGKGAVGLYSGRKGVFQA